MALANSEVKFVLLEWTEGEDKGAHSILTVDCVRQFSVSEFLNKEAEDGEDDVIHLVEWRQGRKPWPVYQAKILHVASM